jgi:S1-C subfamily serine protease
MGSRHIVHGYGVPHQLKDLGETDVATLVPWDRDADCKDLVAGYADAVFGVAAPVAAADRRPRLGVYLEQAAEGVRIRQVEKGSIAEASGVRAGDVVLEIAGRPVKRTGDVAGAVQRQAPGTWLPLKVKRGPDTVELVAKFPPQLE